MNFLTFGLLLLLSTNLRAQESEEDFDSPESRQTSELDERTRAAARETPELMNNIQPPHPSAEVKHKIIYARNNTVVAPGDIISIVIGFENTGKKPLFITDVCASMTAPYDPSTLVRNYSAMHHNISARPNEQHSIEYPFHIDTRTNPLPYGIIAVVFYMDAKGNEFSSVACNTSFPITEVNTKIGTRAFLIIVGVVTLLITVGIVMREKVVAKSKNIYQMIQTGTRRRQKGKGKSGSKSPSGSGDSRSSRDGDDSWLSGTSADQYRKTRRETSQSPNPSSKNRDTKRGRSQENTTSTKSPLSKSE